ncbi:MAG: thioredoxin family protein [Magnetococcales bacterium]|nr:thioredoxin family protein [Magnetococcales bacterium]
MALLETPRGELGSRAPAFSLPGVDGHILSLEQCSASPVLLVMFLCNHCPYVQAILDRLVTLGREYPRSRVAMVAINSNDATQYPEDSFANMQGLAKTMNFPFPYLLDETQEVARAYGAVCTPDLFLYDAERALRYRGRLDDAPRDPERVRQRELKEAIDALLQGKPISPLQNPSLGCSIKWRRG